jgi:hypothetical protein
VSEHRPATSDDLRELFGDQPEGYDAEAERRWGDTAAWRESQERTKELSKEEWAELKAEGEAVTADFAAALRSGVPAGAPQAMNIAERHRLSIERFYHCSPEFHRNLGDLYASDPRFAAAYDDVEPGLAAYVRAAIHANADWSERG